MEIKELQKIAKDLRRDIIEMIYRAKSGHPGGSLSIADIMAVLYWNEMNVDPANPKMENRDRFVLSKGHAAPALYASLIEKGYASKDLIPTLRRWHSPLQGHPDMKKLPGVEMSTGSLGQGFSVAVGMALADKLDGKDNKTFVLLGDGELQEGIVWEAAMAANHYGLKNLTAVVDWNGLQIDGKNDDVMTVKPVDEKFRAFGWDTVVIDGHSFRAIQSGFDFAQKSGKPVAIVAKTHKGNGVSFMKDNAGWHGKAPNREELQQAVLEIEGE